MPSATLAPGSTSTQARVGAVMLALAAFTTLLLTHTSMSLAPARLFVVALSVFAVWSFCDEMGLRKPLNRAGFVLFALSIMAKTQIILGVNPEFVGRYELLHATALLGAILFWSVAFLHRQRALKVVGTVGVLTSAAPLVALVAGHLLLGVGTIVGVDAIQSSAGGATGLVERFFGLWGYAAAWLLWKGLILVSPNPSS